MRFFCTVQCHFCLYQQHSWKWKLLRKCSAPTPKTEVKGGAAHLWTCRQSHSRSHCCHLEEDTRHRRDIDGRVAATDRYFKVFFFTRQRALSQMRADATQENLSRNSKWVANIQRLRHLSGRWLKATVRTRTSQWRSLHIVHRQLLQPLLPTFSAVDGVDPLHQLSTGDTAATQRGENLREWTSQKHCWKTARQSLQKRQTGWNQRSNYSQWGAVF